MDELADKLGLFRGELARWSASSGTVHGRSLLRTPACRQGGSNGDAVGRQDGLEGSGEWTGMRRGSTGVQRAGARGE